MTDPLLLELMERVRGRFYGKYRGTVTETDAATMRLKADVPAVLPGAATGWCMPCVPYAGPDVGVLMLPEVGSGVWIEFEGGDVSYPIWVGCFWRSGEVPSDAAAGTKSIVTSTGRLSFDTDAGSVSLLQGQQDSVVLDGSGVALRSGSASVVLGPDGVSVNDGALEVS